ncbi:MAG: hypothetical protein R3A45_11445 [Bdellovibrionota bacterium]
MSEELGFDYEVSVAELHCKPKITDQNSAKHYLEIASDLFLQRLAKMPIHSNMENGGLCN